MEHLSSDNLTSTPDTLPWLINVTNIHFHGSSVIAGNYTVFYIVHILAVWCIILSLTCCAAVITSIVRRVLEKRGQTPQNRSSFSLDFSDRFPLYLAVADGLLNVSHLTDHLFLLITQEFPIPTGAILFSFNLWAFLSYQQVMNAGLAVFTYLRIVRDTDLNMGKFEWKLHSTAAVFVFASTAIFYPLDAFGISGYWMLLNYQTTGGISLSIFGTCACIVQACCTVFAYTRIRRVVKEGQKTAVAMRSTRVTTHSTASACLSVFVRISIVIITSCAIFHTAIVIQFLHGFLEPVTVLVYVTVFNCVGTLNAFGYFYNQRIKAAGKLLGGGGMGNGMERKPNVIK